MNDLRLNKPLRKNLISCAIRLQGLSTNFSPSLSILYVILAIANPTGLEQDTKHIMPATAIYGAHLEQQELSDDIKSEIQDVGAWLLTPAGAAKFVRRTDRRQTYTVDIVKDEKVKPLLDKLGFAQATPPAACLIYHITGPSFLQNSSGPASILPITVSGGTPTAGGKQLEVGYITYTTADVLIEPDLYILVCFPIPSTDL